MIEALSQSKQLIASPERFAMFPRVTMINFLQLTAKQKEVFSSEVAQCQCTCQIWVHAWYDDKYLKTAEFTPFLPAFQFVHKRKKLIERSLQSKMPIIALIEYGTYESEEDAVKRYGCDFSNFLGNGQDGRSIYYIPTFTQSSDPCTSVANKVANIEQRKVNYEAKKYEWDVLVKKMKKVGIRQVIISGAYYRLSTVTRDILAPEDLFFMRKHHLGTAGDRVDNFPDYCVGNAIVALEARGIKTFLSKVIAAPPQDVSVIPPRGCKGLSG